MLPETNSAPGPAGDAELVSQARDGLPTAFDVLVRRYQGVAVARAYAVLHDRAEAEDAAQEGFLRAFRSLRQLQRPESFGAWLLQIVTNAALRAVEKRAKRPVHLGDRGPGRSPGPHDDLIDAIAALPEGSQEVLHLHYAHGYSCEEIAQMLGLQVGSVTSRLTRARRKLRELLSEDHQR
jgi:RNA polymerase sigma-70 factor (ECF subfamily)